MTNLANPMINYPVAHKGAEDIDINNISQQAVSTVSNENSTLNSMMISPDVLMKTALCLPPIVLADRFVNSKLSGEESNTILKKIANLGDKISHKLKLDNFTGEKINNFIQNNRFTKFFTSDYSANARCSLAKFPSMPERYSNELAEQLVKLKDNPQFKVLFSDGKDALTKEAKDFIINLDPKIAKNDTAKLLNVTEELLSKGVDNVKKGGILSEPVNLSALRNNLKTAQSQMGTTKIGSELAKGALDAKRHLTFGGGIFGLAFVSFAFNQAFKSASEAPDGEKISTFMHVLSEQFVGFLLFQPSISLMYRLGGNKYRGMTKEARQALEDLVQKTNADETITKEGVKVAKLQRDLLIKGVNKDEVAKLAGKSFEEAENIAKGLKSEGNLKFWERPLKAIGKVLSMGLDEIQPTKFTLFGHKFKPTFTGSFGGFARFAMILFIIQPFLQKPVTNLCHKIFGKPTEYLKKEEGENTEQSNMNSEPSSKTKNEETNLINKWTNLPDSAGFNNNNAVANPQIENNNPIASSNLSANSNQEYNLYVPSIQVDNSYLQNQENDTTNRVNEILKRTNSKVAQISDSLK